MQRHDHIHLVSALVGSDIAVKEFQGVIAEFLCKLRAVLDHVCFQIQTGDPHRVSL